MTEPRYTVNWEGLLEMPEMPSASDHLFAGIGDPRSNACLNWLPGVAKWDLYATGYKEAADLLVLHVVEQYRRHDTLVYPILFLYRQYLELAIKDLIRDANHLQDKGISVPKTHRIDQLWRICQSVLVEVTASDSEDFRQVGRLIDEFSKTDPTSMAFRYPEDREGNCSLEGITHINLQNVKNVIGKVALILGGAGCMLGEYLSHKAEMEREYQDHYC